MRNWLLIILLIFSFCVVAQRKKKVRDTSSLIFQPTRVEFSLEKRGTGYTPVLLEKQGILLVERTGESLIRNKKRVKGYTLWKFHLLDTALAKNWEITIPVNAEGDFIGYDFSESKCYLLFKKKLYNAEKLHVLQLDIQTKQYQSLDITTVFPINLSIFEVVNETLILGGETENKRSILMTIHMSDQIPRVVPGFYNNTKILNVLTNDQSGLFSVTISELLNKRPTLLLKTFTSKGDLVQEHLIKPKEDKSILDGAITNFKGGVQYLAGTYSKKRNRYSQGFYLSKLIQSQTKASEYYPFATLENFFSYYGKKREARIKKRIEKKKGKGKIKRFNYRLLVHEIIPTKNGYTMVAEAYYPKYKYAGDPFSTSGRSQPIFIGYEYTHAVVVNFDKSCKVNWDNTFKIEDILTMNLTKHIVVSSFEDQIVLAYMQNNEIRSKIISGNEVVEGGTFNPIKLLSDVEKINSSSSSIEGLQKWYDNKLIAFGEQNISMKGTVGLGGRKVFYINKIEFQLTDSSK